MGLLSSLLGIIGFGIGIPLGLLLGYFFLIFFLSGDVKDPISRSLHELDRSSLVDLSPEIPSWVKHPDYDRTDWLNKFVFDVWPFLDKATCGIIKSMTKPIFEKYVGKFLISSVEFKTLTLGTLPPSIGGKYTVRSDNSIVGVRQHLRGMKVQETNENELVFEPAVRWAGNPDITLVLKLVSLQIKVQLMDVQICAAPRIVLKPLVPTFPCFASAVICLIDEPQIDFGLKLLGVDIMAIPGLYQIIQEILRKQICSLYLWPHTLEIPILDDSVGTMKKPVGILHVKVVKALNLLKMDLMGLSDPYVQLNLTGERITARKTSIKMKNLNPEWKEEFKLAVKDPKSQVLELHVFDWEKLGTHDKLGMQVVPLSLLTPNETKEFMLDLVKNTNPNDPKNKKQRGQLVVEMMFNPFKEDSTRVSGPLARRSTKKTEAGKAPEEDINVCGAGLLTVRVQGAQNVQGKHHNNPYALVIFRGEEKKTKLIKKTQDPSWNEEFQFVLEEAPSNNKLHIQVLSRRTGIGFRRKVESLGHVNINLSDVVYNGRINKKYHLIDSRNGVLHVEMRWEVT